MALMGILMVLRDNSLSTSGTSLVRLLHFSGKIQVKVEIVEMP